MKMSAGKQQQPIYAKAYEIVSVEEEKTSQPNPIPQDLIKPATHRVRAEFSHIPEASGLSWEDEFFEEDNEDVIAAFDLDYDSMEAFYASVGWTCYVPTAICFPSIFWLSVFLGVPCFLNRNVRWNVRNQHVAITRDGVQFVQDRHPTCWGCASTDAGKRVKTIPFDKITDCDIVEPAGNTCVWIPNTLYSVRIDTASASPNHSSLTINGLKDPIGFKKLLLAIKRMRAPFASAAMDRSSDGLDGAGNNTENVTDILRDIRAELRQHREVLETLQSPVAAAHPVAPPSAQEVNII